MITRAQSGLTAPARGSLRLALATLRPRQWAHFCLLPAAGLDPRALEPISWLGLGLGRGVAIAALSLAYAYGLNSIHDRAMDLDRRKNPLAGLATVPPAAMVLVAACGVAALLLSATGGAIALAATAISVAAATLYSAGPRAKCAPIVGTVLNVPIFAPLLLVSLETTMRAPALPVLLVSFIALLVQNQLLHELSDATEDARGGVRTTAQILGHRGTAAAALAVGVAGAFAAIQLAPSRSAGLAGACALVIAGLAALPISTAARRRAAHHWLSLLGGGALFAAGWVSA